MYFVCALTLLSFLDHPPNYRSNSTSSKSTIQEPHNNPTNHPTTPLTLNLISQTPKMAVNVQEFAQTQLKLLAAELASEIAESSALVSLRKSIAFLFLGPSSITL